MKYHDFIEFIKKEVIHHVSPSHKVVIQPFVKNNGAAYDGLLIIDPLLNISPAIYLNPYYHRYLNGISLDEICTDILNTYHENIPKEDFDVSLFKDFQKAKKRIIMKLVNYQKNQELLMKIPHIKFHDLAIVFMCSVTDFLEEYATILIYNHHLHMWNIDSEELYQTAMYNTPRQLPAHYERMEDYFERVVENDLSFLSELDMYLLTNNVKIHGATCMVYPKLLKSIAKELDDNLIIIPSSIHELLILPEKSTQNKYTLKNLQDMICEVNDTQLTDAEILSDHAYIYMQTTDKIIY